MTVFDWIILALVLFFAVKSFLRGAVREVASLLALLLGCIISFNNYSIALPLVQQRIASPWAQTIAAGALVFLAVYLGVLIAGWFVAWLMQALQLGFLDRCAGCAVGVVKGYLFVCLILGCALLLPNSTDIIRNSRLSWYCLPAIKKALPYCPQPLDGVIRDKIAILTQPPQPPAHR
ncbi:MAG: CvpA family protein [Desulfobacterota bacterium]|nr:CvpA family protein [Thermodesulfobacteriota bacterium]